MAFEDYGFLPIGISSPYEYYISRQNYEQHMKKELFYDSLEVPEGWSVWSDSMTVGIYYMGSRKASVCLQESQLRRESSLAELSGKEIVQSVEWCMEDGWIYRVDYYNKYGLKYASEFR